MSILMSMRCSETTFEKRSKLFANKNVEHSDDCNGDTASSIAKYNEDVEYISEVIRAFVCFSRPTISMEAVLPRITDAAVKIIKMAKFFEEVKTCNDK